MKIEQIAKITSELSNDGGLSYKMFEFAQEESFQSAVDKVQIWQQTLEEMLEIARPETGMCLAISSLLAKVNNTLENLLLWGNYDEANGNEVTDD